jgi:hypothetical protein
VIVGLIRRAAVFPARRARRRSAAVGHDGGLLNFAPYVGPLIGILVMLVMGFVSYDETWQSLLPAALYLGLHTLEGRSSRPSCWASAWRCRRWC